MNGGARSATDSWLDVSGQRWKLRVFYALILAAAGILVAFVLKVNEVEWVPWGTIPLAFALIFVGASALGWICLAVRCPRCGYRPVPTVLRQAPSSVWLAQVQQLTHCPRCGLR